MAGNFNHFDQERQRVLKAAKAGMQKAVTQFEADTKMLTHVQTGDLRRSWTHKVEASDGHVEGAVGSNLRYAPYEDDYHPNISEALNTNVQSYFNIVAEAIKPE